MAAPTIALEIDTGTLAPEPEPPRKERQDADPFGLDPDLRRRVLPAMRFLHDRYWRVEVTGAHHLPTSGPAVVVSNHSGALPFDGAMICTAV